MGVPRWVGRAVGLDVHCVLLRGRDLRGRRGAFGWSGAGHAGGVEALAESLVASDRVALEVTGSCWEVARILEPHVNTVVVVAPDDTGDLERASEDGQARRADAREPAMEGRA